MKNNRDDFILDKHIIVNLLTIDYNIIGGNVFK